MTMEIQRCMLDADGLAAVAARYAEAAMGYVATATLDATVATVDLRGPKPALAHLLDEMVVRESGCCSHLTFDIAETATGYRVMLGTTQPEQPAQAELAEALAVLFPTAEVTQAAGAWGDIPGAAPGPVRG